VREIPAERTRRDEYKEATHHALLVAGRNIFAQEGFQGTRIEMISRAARVTRGALYHHFEDKKALFDAVVVLMQAEAAVKIEKEARKQPKIWDRLTVGIGAYLDICLDPAYARIVVQEAPAVLGADRYREIEETYPQALLKETLKALKRQGELDCQDIDLLSRVADAMICKMAILLPDAKDPKRLRKRGQVLIVNLLEGIRKR